MLRFLGFEPDGEWTLRALFAAVDREGQAFRVVARVLSNGALVDGQASDRPLAGSSGRADVDQLLPERIQAELARARAVATVVAFDGRQRSAA